MVAAIQAVHDEGLEFDDWPDAVTAEQFARARNESAEAARHRLARMVSSGKLESKMVRRKNTLGRMVRTMVYRIKK